MKILAESYSHFIVEIPKTEIAKLMGCKNFAEFSGANNGTVVGKEFKLNESLDRIQLAAKLQKKMEDVRKVLAEIDKLNQASDKKTHTEKRQIAVDESEEDITDERT